MAESLQRLAPGSIPVFDSGLALASFVSVIWFIFVGWRLTHRPIVVWRGPWLAAAGITAFSASLIGLYHSALDINRSYEPVVKAVALNLADKGFKSGDLVCGIGLNHGLQALFKHYAGLDILVRAKPDDCRFTIERTPQRHRIAPDSFSRPHTDEAFIVIHNR